ncbi:MAG TPA: glycosyltransferase family 2 protein [Chryseosolibacter sp.]|nr:glycosyltransferase family 2 protein [Chryseosolibacter sp.]
MKLYAICVIKNEADIICFTIGEALKWADKIIVYDNGSDDGTWEAVNKINDARVVAYKHDNRPYSDGLRADIFNNFKHEMTDDDWWVIVDGDEVFEENPRDFILKHPGYFHHINGKKVDFSFNLSQVDELEFKGEFALDKHLFTYYTPEAWSEPRLIKHRRRLKWEVKKIWPSPMGIVCPDAILIRHFPLRSKQQIMRRWETRHGNTLKGGQTFNHWEKGNWRDYYAVKSSTLKQLYSVADAFRDAPFMNEYRQGWLKNTLKYFLHKTGFFG